MSEWSGWSSCSKTCGSGSQSRTRKVITKAKDGGKDCPTTKEENQECNTKSCPGAYPLHEK